ncbi:MAG TPA: nucleotidyltransferase [Aquificaceae bacterium]|uniref:Nucleotidyltransferase n=1 Tax=Hydrogenobacter sp. TaxID=2152829 RepID=A0A7C2VIX3_9AQUI|nr:nucleotidyltransferase [Aquificaceae bacterium]QWK13170.1 MAG: nucleotidyltransferase [Aquificota bacterium]HAV40424.1 nucleotidyltransferase [Aquificaceae bacterium]HCO38979.1 nucleotidyltransferase [Aquificaceae bacterium]
MKGLKGSKKVETLEDVKVILKELKPRLEKEYNVKEIGIFDSRIRKKQIKRGTIDILVEFYKPPTFFEFIRLENYLSETIGKKVNLISKEALESQEVPQEIAYV